MAAAMLGDSRGPAGQSRTVSSAQVRIVPGSRKLQPKQMMTANPPLHIMDAAATRTALPFARLIPALREQFVVGCEVPARHVHRIADSVGNEVTSLLMPAWTRGDGGFYGVKIINVAPANAARGLPALHASYLLHDAITGRPLALIDGDELTARRTVAASALAASFLARADARRLLVIGAGRIAALLPEAYREVRELGRVEVWARRSDAAESLAARWRGAGFDAHAVTALGSAVRAADIVSCATLSTVPLIHGAWLGAGSHLDLIGSFTPAMREADDDCLRGASLYADTEEALAKSGDLLGPIERGVFAPADLRGTLASLCRGQAVGRRSDAERTVFKSVGTALEDLAAAVLAHGQGSSS
jgi:ornithine cyclodeaminase/alanine dehydrogenase-like protein (mu-crystallin family)